MAYDLSAFKPEIWSSNAIIARDSNDIVASLVDRTYEAEMQYGDVLHVPSIANLSTVSVANDGTDLTYTQINNTSTTDITVGTHEAVPLFFTRRDMKQMLESQKVVAAYAEKAGKALQKSVDLDLLGLAADASTTTGSAGTDLDDADLREIARKFDVANVPQGDRFLVVYPDQIEALRSVDKLVRADSLGDRNRITTAYEIPEAGYFGEVYGIHIYTTSNVPAGAGSPAGRVNLAFHRSAIALVMQMGVTVDGPEFDIDSQSFKIVTSALWGVKTMRADHMVKVLS